MKIEHQLELPAPPAQVWPWIAEPARLAQWIRDVQRFELRPAGALAAGSTLLAQLERGSSLECRVECCTAGRELVLLASGLPNDMQVRLEFELQAAGGGSRLVLRAETELTGLMIFAESMIASKARAKLEGWSSALRTALAAG